MSQPSRARSNAEAEASKRRAEAGPGGPDPCPVPAPVPGAVSGRESQHRDAGGGHGRLPFMTVPLTAVTGGGVPPM